MPILAIIGADDKSPQLTVGASTAVKLPLTADMKVGQSTAARPSAQAETALDKLRDQI